MISAIQDDVIVEPHLPLSTEMSASPKRCLYTKKTKLFGSMTCIISVWKWHKEGGRITAGTDGFDGGGIFSRFWRRDKLICMISNKELN